MKLIISSKRIVSLLSVAGLCLAVACQGTLADDDNGAGGSASGGGGKTSGGSQSGGGTHSGGSSAGGQASGGAPSSGGVGGGDGVCRASYSEVSAIWGFTCPEDYCAGVAAVCEGEESFLTQAQKYQWRCGLEKSVYIDLGTHGQVCHYRDDALVGAAVSDDRPTFCDDTSYRMVAGEDLDVGDCGASQVELCSGPGGNGGEGGRADSSCRE